MSNRVSDLISRRLKVLMEEQKLRDMDVLRRCGFTRPTLNKIQNGGNITVVTLSELAKGLNVPVGFFFDESGTNSIATGGNYSTVAENIDSVLIERIRAMESMLKEKDERINDLRRMLNIIDKLNIMQ